MHIVRKQAFPRCSSLVSIATVFLSIKVIQLRTTRIQMFTLLLKLFVKPALSRPKCVGLIIFASNAQIELLRSGRKFSDNEEDNRVSGDRPKIALTSTER
ncbi:hypothetical protein Tsp_07137 [Trichinella spiralis]|uniref:hypothetical protein n=1 Tax=Trichinella spiralis TaxID=6334 RepID=UPI0001EFBB7F|nr:hypothetical protein Tsp_07137 [Trichinella spiralis]